MKVLYLYSNPIALELAEWLKTKGNNIVVSSAVVTVQYIRAEKFDLIISYSYKHILSEEIINAVNGNAVNLHISYLPWNRGADPNQWSWIENTPKGVTIHYMNAQLDSGDIIAQRNILFDEDITFAESYKKLNEAIIRLFQEIYPYYSMWNGMRKKCLGQGSYHNSIDFNKYMGILSDYNMKVKDFLIRINGMV